MTETFFLLFKTDFQGFYIVKKKDTFFKFINNFW